MRHESSDIPLGDAAPNLTAGLDIGGTRAKVGLWDCTRGRVLTRAWIDTVATPDPAAVLHRFAAAIAQLCAIEGIPASGVCGVGIACAGFVDAATGTVQESPNLPAFRGAPLAAMARALFPDVLVALDNDANACAVASISRPYSSSRPDFPASSKRASA